MSFVLKMIQEGEHQFQDFKLRIDDSRKIAKSLVAFANTGGGRLLIGVRDHGEIADINPEEELHMIVAAAEMYCDPPVEFQSQVWKVDFNRVLEIFIEPSENKPHFAIDKNKLKNAFMRVDDKNIRANGVIIEVWKQENSPQETNFYYDKEKEKLFEFLRKKKTINFFLVSKITKLSFKQTEEMLAKLITWNILKINISEKTINYSMKED